MGNVVSLLVGAVITITGLFLLLSWRYEILFLIRGILPIILIIGGVIAVAAAFSRLKDMLKNKS